MLRCRRVAGRTGICVQVRRPVRCAAAPTCQSFTLNPPEAPVATVPRHLTLRDVQERIRDIYGQKDASRGRAGTFMWFMEEVGELSSSLRSDDRDNLELEFADVLAWLATLANIADIDLNAAMIRKYGDGCPDCGATPCLCSMAEKP